MFKKQLLILLIICWSQHSSCLIDDLFTIGKKGWDFMKLLNDVKSSKDTSVDFAQILSDEKENKEILEKLEGIDNQLQSLKSFTTNQLNQITALLNTLPDEIELRSMKREIAGFILSTNEKWVSLVNFAKNKASKNAYSSLATQTISTIGENLSKFRNDLTPLISITPSDSGFFMLVAKHAQDKRDVLCGQGETFHQTLTRLYQIVTLTDIKAYILLTFAYTVTLSKDDGKSLLETLEQNFRKQFLRYSQEYTKSLSNEATPYLRACDQKAWRRGEDFHMLAGLLQQTIYREPKCWSNKYYTCQELADGKSISSTCDLVEINEHSKCDGQLYDCNEIRHPLSRTEVCVWSEGPYKIRYLLEEGKRLGTDLESECPTGDLVVASLGFHEVDAFCTCQCRSTKWKILLAMMRSREEENYVIVGMRINILRDYLYIQIAEGKLESNGYISDFSWVPGTRLWSSVEGLAWATLLPTPIPKFFFNDHQLNPGYVLTGVAFATTGSTIQQFTIQMVGRKFDYRTGQLTELSHGNHISPPYLTPDRELKYSAKNPINMKPYVPSHPDSQGYTHILLRQSDLSDDYGQSLLPLFDSVPVVTNPLSPIGGVGLFHKGYDQHSGFISLRLYPINYVNFIDTFLREHDLTSLSTWDH